MAKRDPVPAWQPPVPKPHITAAMKALARGEASMDQQIAAMNWIVDTVADTYGLSYRPGVDGDRETAFAEGRRFVGLLIRREITITEAELKRREQQ